MDLLGRDRLYATEWVERTFGFVRSARTALRSTGELAFIITVEERDFAPERDLADLIAISESLMIYDSSLYVDSYYFIYNVSGNTAHKIGHIYTEDLLAYNHSMITLQQVMDRLEYVSLFDSIEEHDQGRSES